MRAAPLVPALVILAAALALLDATAQETTAKAKKAAPPGTRRIIPLVVVAPGETRRVPFAVECSVGLTRGGGLAVAEMVNGERPAMGLPREKDKTFRRAGVTVTVPDMDEAPKFDKQARAGALVALADVRAVFEVTVTADADAEPVAIDLHLLDATCSGHCHADFTVVVAAPAAEASP